jgi:hypothetical protein
MGGRRALHVLKVIAIVAVAITVVSFLTMHLWNWLMPAVFGLHAITWPEALGLLVLSRILMGGFRRPGGGCGPRWGWRRKMNARWEQMTPEERERFRAGMRGRWGCGGFGPEPETAAEQKQG